MPKPTKLHSKGKPVSIQKPTSPDDSQDLDPADLKRQFELELCWCIQKLEKTLHSKKDDDKKLQETWKVLTILKNNNQPVIRKRQLMRTHFGDYRAKMAAEEKKLVKLAGKMSITEKPEAKATFLRKSAFLSTGDSSFRFNFNLAPEQEDKKAGNTEEQVTGNPGDSGSANPETQKSLTEDNSDNFKFKFSGSEFKFNFDVENNS